MSSPSSGASAPQPAPDRLTIVPPREPERRRSRSWILLPIIAAVLVAAWLWKTNTATQSTAAALTAVRTATAGPGSVQSTIRINGTLAAQKAVTITAPRILGSRSGLNRGGDNNFGPPPGAGGGGGDFTLTLLTLAKAGTRVHTGDTVAQFDTQNQLQRLDDYKDTVLQMENSLKSLTASVASAKEAFTQQVRSAKSDWQKAILDLQTAPIRADIDVEKYKLSVEEMEAAHKALVAQAAFLETSQQAQLRSAQLNLDQARIELQRAENNVKRMTIKAPMDGVVVMASIVRNGEYGQIREGDQVSAGQPFVSIVDPSSMVLDAAINQVDAERMHLGQRAVIHVDAYPDIDLPGIVIGTGAMSKSSTFRARFVGELPIRVRIQGADPRLIPDLTGSAILVLNQESADVTVPREAVFQDEGATVVYAQGPEGWLRKPIQIGAASFTTVAVHTGLDKGAVVALSHP
jgi:HlyD family secretion protein